MSRTHLVIIECTTPEQVIELRHLVNVNAPRAAAQHVLQKLCPNTTIQSSHDGATGLHATVDGLRFTVRTIQPVRSQDVLTLSRYYPISAPVQACA